MNLRVPEDQDRRLEQLAVEEHASKSALLLQGAELVLQRHARCREISAGLDFVMSNDAELLTRLDLFRLGRRPPTGSGRAYFPLVV